MNEKRRPGRPVRYDQPKRHVTLTLSDALLRALEDVTANRSEFIERVLRAHPDVAAALVRHESGGAGAGDGAR